VDGLEFIAAVIGHLAWPATVIVVVASLKEPIKKLIPNIRKAKWGDRELEFGEKVEAVKAEVEQLPGPAIGDAVALPPPAEKGRELPAGMHVIHDFMTVEQELLALAEAAGMEVRRGPSMQVAAALKADGLIDGPTVAAFNDLRQLRNIAAHTRAVTDQEAEGYAETAETLRRHLAWIRGRLESSRSPDSPPLS
jgi:hypothetical protein